MSNRPESTVIPKTYQYAILTRQELDVQTISPKELLAIYENSRHQLEIHLTRMAMTEREILRRDAEGDSMANEDFTYEVVPDPHSTTETAVVVHWKPGRHYYEEF